MALQHSIAYNMKTTPVIKYWVIASSGILVSFLFFYLINENKRQKNNAIVEKAISSTELKINDELEKIDLVVESMSFFFENTPYVSQELFENFTNPFKQGLNGIKSLVWAPRVIEENKESYQKTFQKIQATNATQKSTVYNAKKEYYPITFRNPSQKLNAVVGYDLYSESTRKQAIDYTTKYQKMAFTGPIQLIHDNKDIPGFLAMNAITNAVDENAKGIVAIVYRMDHFLQNTLNTELDILDLTITDQSANNPSLYTSLSTINQAHLNTIWESRNLNADNRAWKINFYPKKIYTEFPHTLESYFVLLFGLMTTILLVVNIRERDKRSFNLENKVRERTKALEISNKQKENLLREIHHRVMNNLQITSSLMNLQKRKLEDEEAIYALTSSQDRINAIAMIHQKIYQHDGADAVDLKGYLENLIKSHKRISPLIQYEIDCPEVFIDLDSAVPLAIITSEIVVNALKHAFTEDSESNMLYILVTPMRNDVIDLVISDNGKGFPKNFNSSKERGLGHEIIKKLCRQLQAKYEYSSSTSGTAFSLRFKQRKLQIPVFA